MSAGNWVALSGILLTCFLASVAGAVRFIDSRVERGDSKLSHTIAMLDLTMQSIRDELRASKQEHREQLERVVYEVSHTNDGSTLKGAVVTLGRRVDAIEHKMGDQ